MSYRLENINGKWYVQTETGRYLGGYVSLALAQSLLNDLLAEEREI